MAESRLPRSTSLAATRGSRSYKSGLAALASGKGPTPPAQAATPAPSQVSQVSQSTRSTRAKAQGKHRPTASTASAVPSTTSAATTTAIGRPLRPSRSSGTIAPSASNQNVALNNAKRIVAQSSTIRRTVGPAAFSATQLTTDLGHSSDAVATEAASPEPQATVCLRFNGGSGYGRDAIVERGFAIGEQARAADRRARGNPPCVASPQSKLTFSSHFCRVITVPATKPEPDAS